MFSILLVIIYLSFISLGLPDSLLGSAWPSMYGGLNVPVSYAGILSMIITGGTIVSSLFSDRLIKKTGTGVVTVVSVAMTAAALFGFSISHSFGYLCLWAIPYGLGAGSVDAALNNFVALHYKAKHMSWLHCFWGIGATAGPYIMGRCLTGGFGWNSGYRIISLLQLILTALLIFSLPLWKKQSSKSGEEQAAEKSLSVKELIRLPGAKPVLVSFFCYCSLEQAAGLWGSSYMVMERGVSADLAAEWISLFFLGITAGRFFSGFITMKLGDRDMIRLGQAAAVFGVICLLLPFGHSSLRLGFALLGIGCGPIYPSLLHATPENFGKEASQSIMGMQMACAYIGSTLTPPIIGMIAEHIGLKFYPFILLLIVFLMFTMVEMKNRNANRCR